MSADVLALHAEASRDARLDSNARVVLCQVARAGRVGDLQALAAVCRLKRATVERSLDKLSKAGYLPGPTTRGIRHDAARAA